MTPASLAIALATVVALAGSAAAQNVQQTPTPGPPLPFLHAAGPSAPPELITLSDALARARQNDAQFQTSAADAQIAAGDRVQAGAARFPAFSHTTQGLFTQGNDTTPNGRFVTNDGPQVYRDWLVMHQELSANTLGSTPYHRAQAGEAVARARLEIAQRGLVVTVTRAYYTLVAAQRRYGNAQQADAQAQRFFDIAQQQERLGQAAHADVVKAQIQLLLQQQAYVEAALAIENARLDLAVLVSPMMNENFTVVDDLDTVQPLPPFAEAQTRAGRENPELRVASETLRGAGAEVSIARHAFFPSLAIDAVYGIEANAFALRSVNDAFPEKGPLPNLGYFVTANLTVPIWDWGSLNSKLTQAKVRRQLATVEMTQAQRLLMRNLYASYNDATAARTAVNNTRQAATLADESLRLVLLRYQAGESTALEVVDAQNTVAQTRNAHADALVRDRVAIATLQTVTGSF
jgi:outer membrane protein TolC